MPNPTTTLNIAGKECKIVAVEDETQGLLDVTAQVRTELDYVSKLRRDRAESLNNDEQTTIDRIIENSDKVVQSIERLVEPARVDMHVPSEVRLATQMKSVLRDPAHISASLSRLAITAVNLNRALTILCSSELLAPSRPSLQYPPSRPTYQESEWLHASRRKIIRRRASDLPTNSIDIGSRGKLPTRPNSIGELPDNSTSLHGAGHVAELPDTSTIDAALTQGVKATRVSCFTISTFDATALEKVDSKPALDCNWGAPKPAIIVTQPEKGPVSFAGSARSRSWIQQRLQKQ